MSSFEFYTENTFASCQYNADEFFTVLGEIDGNFPMVKRAHKAFVGLYDEMFGYSKGETKALNNEIEAILEALESKIGLTQKETAIFFHVSEEFQSVFEESESKKSDIRFRWG